MGTPFSHQTLSSVEANGPNSASFRKVHFSTPLYWIGVHPDEVSLDAPHSRGSFRYKTQKLRIRACFGALCVPLFHRHRDGVHRLCHPVVRKRCTPSAIPPILNRKASNGDLYTTFHPRPREVRQHHSSGVPHFSATRRQWSACIQFARAPGHRDWTTRATRTGSNCQNHRTDKRRGLPQDPLVGNTLGPHAVLNANGPRGPTCRDAPTERNSGLRIGMHDGDGTTTSR